MNTKLTNPEQVMLLHEGNLIKRFPCNCDDGPTDTFDESNTDHTITYEILSINRNNGIFSLISSNFRTIVSAAPGDVSRLFIKGADLVSQKVWWINS